MKKEKDKMSNCPVFGLYRVSRILMKTYSQSLKTIGLTYPQYLVMQYLWGNGEASVDEIGSELLLDSGTLTPLLKRLQSKGLICRVRDTKDERRCIITLTSEGNLLETQANAAQQKVIEHFNLDPKLIKNLNSVLNQILDISHNK